SVYTLTYAPFYPLSLHDALPISVNSAVSLTINSMLSRSVLTSPGTGVIAYTELIGIIVKSIKSDNNIASARSNIFLVLIMALLRSEEHTSELQSRFDLVCSLLLE